MEQHVGTISSILAVLGPLLAVAVTAGVYKAVIARQQRDLEALGQKFEALRADHDKARDECRDALGKLRDRCFKVEADVKVLYDRDQREASIPHPHRHHADDESGPHKG